MREADFSTWVPHPPEAVWDFISDPCNDPLWRQKVSEARLIAGKTGLPGTRYREFFAWHDFRFESTIELVEAERPHTVFIVGDELGYRVEGRYTLTPEEGGTRVAIHLSMQMLGTLEMIGPFAWHVTTTWSSNALSALGKAMDDRIALSSA